MNNQSQNAVSAKTLFLATCTAIVLASLALLLFVLPAEYNIDPTGVGQSLGLTALSPENKQIPETQTMHSELAKRSPESLSSGIGFHGNTEFEVFEIVIPARAGVEFKFSMDRYAKMGYEWVSSGAALYFDLHGEPASDTSGYFESYSIASADQMQGSFTAPFNGSHGWYWKNGSSESLVIQLKVKGQYVVIGKK